MDKIKSLQLKYILSSTKEQIRKFLKQIDIYGISQEKDFLGYSPLHFAATYFSPDLAAELIGLGANVLKQELSHQKTPLHLVINAIDFAKKKISLYEEMRDFVNLLLSAHIQTANATNPKCNDGVSHFHIACLFDHTEAINFFINAGEPINQVTNTGCTPLHFAVKSSSVDAVKMLLMHGADISLKDVKGVSSLDRLSELCIEANYTMAIEKCVSSTSYENDIKWIDSILTFLLELKANDKTFLDNSELRVTHVACMLKNKSVVEILLKKGYKFNEVISEDLKTWPGWVPLHFAACCNVETVELLIQNGVNINARNKKGQTPLDLCAMKYAPEILSKVLSEKNELECILFSDGSTKLTDLLRAMNNYDEFNNLLSNLTNINITVSLDSVLWPGYSILHLSVMINESTMAHDNHPESVKFQGSTDSIVEDDNEAEEKVEVYTKRKRIEMCLEKGCDVNMKDTDGLTPIHLAFEMRKIDVVRQLISYCKEDAVDPHSLSDLHIACAVDDKDAVKKLLSKGANVNRPIEQGFEMSKPCYLNYYPYQRSLSIRAQFTPLHIAVIFNHSELAKYLVENGADVLAKDARGLTPIHLSMHSYRHVAECLLGHTLKDSSSLKEVTFPQNFSYLFVAARADDDKAIEKLLQNGAQVDVPFPEDDTFEPEAAGLTPLHLAVKENSDKAVRALIEGGANIYAENPHRSHDSPLQRATQKASHELFQHFAKYLKRNVALPGPLDSSGLTQLHLACVSLDLDWAKELLAKGADVNAAVSRTNEEGYKVTGVTPLLMLVDRGTTILATPNFMDLLQLLLEEGADVTISTQEGLTPLLLAHCKHVQQKKKEPMTDYDYYFGEDEIEDEPLPFLQIADMLLENQESFNLNPMHDRGFSHFHYACLRNNVEIVKKFLDNAVDVNQVASNLVGRGDIASPLDYAIVYRSERVIPLLLECGADVNGKYICGNTPLHVAIRENFVDLQLIDTLISHGANINARNLAGETPMRFLLNVKSLTSEKLKFFIDRGAEIDVTNGEPTSKIFDDAMKNAANNDVVYVFKTLLKTYGVDRVTEIGSNAIHSLVTDYNEDRTLDFYMDTIKQFLELGCELNWQNEHGETALHKASTQSVHAAIEALLILGADVNIIDENDNSPLTRQNVELAEEDYCDELGANYFSTIKTFVTHYWKMRLVQLDVINFFAIAAQLAEESWNFDENCKRTFQDELMKIESTKIGQSVPLQSFLSEWGAVVNYPMMTFMQREEVDIYFGDFDSLRREFPELCGLLMMQYRKALDRVDLIKFAKHVIISECEIVLPDLCLEGIFKYFKNNDLKILVADTSEALNPRKRRKM